jgi:hypothetical protein
MRFPDGTGELVRLGIEADRMVMVEQVEKNGIAQQRQIKKDPIS